jgi:pyridoxine 4-dehydrogenase
VHLVTKVGIIVRDEQGGWLPGNSPQSLREQVHDNLRRLGLDVLDVVYLRTLTGIDEHAVGTDTLAPQFEALAELQQQGLIRHLGVSTVSLGQLAEAQQIAPVACVQNIYNIANRADAAVLAATAGQHIAYVPYFPLGASRRCSPACWTRPPGGSARPRPRSPSPGCCSVRRTSC